MRTPHESRRAGRLIALLAAAAAFGHALAAGLPVARRVLEPPPAGAAMAVVDGRLWVASRGGGLIGFERGAPGMRFDLGRGLPSAVAQELAALPDGRLAVGTQGGLVLVDPRDGSSTAIAPAGMGRDSMAADLVLAATRGNALIFQLTQRDPDGDEGQTGASLWQWDGKRVQAWDPGLGGAVVATAGLVERNDGCFHLAGMQVEGAAQRPWYARQCGGELRSWRLAAGAPAGTVGIAAIARAPDGRSTILVMVTQPAANPASRRHVVMSLDKEGRLSPHCSHASFTEPVTGLVQSGPDLIVARAGAGVHVLGCGPLKPLSADPRVSNATALLHDARLGLLVATDAAVWQLGKDGTPLALTPVPGRALPIDALPMEYQAKGALALLGSPGAGILELARSADGWRLARQWRAGIDLPAGVYGAAAYAEPDQIIAVQLSQGLLRLRPGGTQAVALEQGTMPLDVAVTPGGMWMAAGAPPFGGAGAGLHFLATDGSARFVPLPDRQAQPSGRLLAWPDGRVWAGTRRGIIEADATGAMRRISGDRVDVLYRNASRNIVGAVGASVQYWDGARMLPVLFAVEPAPSRPLGHPVDLVIDDAGRWWILFSAGQLVLLDAQRRHVATLDERAGIAPSSRRLLYLPGSREVLIGSAREGLFSLTWP
ncbi:hypothetical protein [Massilia antarctica]|uniref:hypothetical protein n=1 Tax=Massilia antarctica TaxID=2765360 RepID=UPI0006BB5625|nr:hypothetical protein [Massilia sp. H27-R4]MCY0912213.1 hypothetical protein [Massilia sp. H27-R4]CUI06295.1 hypothetical protein BN2497_7367 [Janthinobacterium sp. CG23_2]CUU30081.1 hypothetical protein BN3177_7367 [Janthinobacterium sp. CG23_2]